VQRTIKRSVVPKTSKNPNAQIGHPQDVQIDGSHGNKPSSLAVDWLTGNIFWCEVDRSTVSLPKGYIAVAMDDGRYKRYIVSSDLEEPTSVAVDPEDGYMFWTDAGTRPKIERSLMDGSNRIQLVTTNIGRPESIVIDFEMRHTIYWADSKLNTIQIMDENGQSRATIVSGGVGGNPLLNRPISVDVFESNMFWVNRESINSVVQQDKFGRGVPVSIVRQLNNPRTLKILHPLRYNTSLIYHPCLQRPGCSHICVITGSFNNHKCLCPQGEINRQQCSKVYKSPKPQPLICRCQNGGVCIDENTCHCEDDYYGRYCEIGKTPIDAGGVRGTPAAVIVPVLLIVIVILTAIGLYFYWRRKAGLNKGLSLSNSVSFRHGSNVEFAGPAFVATGDGKSGQDENNPEFGLKDVTTEGKRDFSNPMYDAMGNMESQAVAAAAHPGGFQLPSDSGSTTGGSSPSGDSTSITVPSFESFNREPPSAILAPSSITHKSSPQLNIRHKEVNPSGVDTGKDTQCLVEEDDSEC